MTGSQKIEAIKGIENSKKLEIKKYYNRENLTNRKHIQYNRNDQQEKMLSFLKT